MIFKLEIYIKFNSEWGIVVFCEFHRKTNLRAFMFGHLGSKNKI
jgi:hypothetical protein